MGLQRVVIFEFIQKTRGLHYLQRICRGRKNDGQQVIRVKGNRRNQVFKFRGGKWLD